MHYSLRYKSSVRLNRNFITYGSDAGPDKFPSLDRSFVSAGYGRPPLGPLRLLRAPTSSSIPEYFETRVRYASEPQSIDTQRIKGTRNQQYTRDAVSVLRERSTWKEEAASSNRQTPYSYVQGKSVCTVSRSSYSALMRLYKENTRCTLHHNCSRRHKTRRHESTTRWRQAVVRCDASRSKWGIPTTSSPTSG
jgi:hypothetical protein